MLNFYNPALTAIKEDIIDAQENLLTNYWNFSIYKKQKFVTI